MNSFILASQVGLLILEVVGILVIGIAAQISNPVLGIIGGAMVVVSIIVMGMVYRLESALSQNRIGRGK